MMLGSDSTFLSCKEDSEAIPPISLLMMKLVFFLAENIFVHRKLHENENVKFEIRISKSETMTKFSKFK